MYTVHVNLRCFNFLQVDQPFVVLVAKRQSKYHTQANRLSVKEEEEDEDKEDG